MRSLGAEVRAVPAVPYRDPNNYVRLSGRIAEEIPGAVWANQFDNLANRRAHYKTTGPEIWEQTGGKVDAWVAATGTGGTYAGVALYLKEKSPSCAVSWLIPRQRPLQLGHQWRAQQRGQLDHRGHWQQSGDREPGGAPVDDAVRIHDQDALQTIYDLLWQEGLFLGGSVGINVAAAVETARRMGPGHTIVTVLCDSGDRYRSRLYDGEWLKGKGLEQPERAA